MSSPRTERSHEPTMYRDDYLGERIAEASSRTRRALPDRTATRLASWSEFGAKIQRTLIHCSRTGVRPAVLMVDVEALVDRHARPEQLDSVGMRLRSRVRATDLVVRIGDRFGVFLQGDVGRHAMSIRERLRRALSEDINMTGTSAQIRPRFGLAVHPGLPISAVELILEAERAMES